jgi:hypothetical protein
MNNLGRYRRYSGSILRIRVYREERIATKVAKDIISIGTRENSLDLLLLSISEWHYIMIRNCHGRVSFVLQNEKRAAARCEGCKWVR